MPITVPGFTGDAVYNLRAALDQAGYVVAKAAGKSGKEAMFPFGKDAVDIVRRFGSKSKDIPKEIFDLMISFQPYEGGQTALYAINKACNTNKHEITIPVLFYVGAVSLTGVMQRGFKWRNPPIWDAAKHEMEIVRVPHGVKPTYNLKLQPSVMICEVEGTGRAPLIGILTHMLFDAERVISAIEAKARAMALIS
jgi:hypothetical protein